MLRSAMIAKRASPVAEWALPPAGVAWAGRSALRAGVVAGEAALSRRRLLPAFESAAESRERDVGSLARPLEERGAAVSRPLRRSLSLLRFLSPSWSA